jgi:threonine dehydrogenase-like Zn-dependent dehydrogenase
MTAAIIVQTASGQYELVERSIPDPGPSGAVIRVEACGICGSEVELLQGLLFEHLLPIAPGHEVVGRIHTIGKDAARRWGVGVDDRVAVMSRLRCGLCRGCVSGLRCDDLQPGEPGSYGWRNPSIDPGLWGGFATHMYLAPGSIVVPMNGDVSLAAASLFNPLANGIEWAIRAGGVQALDSVVVLGCGPQGLGCVVAAGHAGAAEVVVTGVSGDQMRLDMAERLGAKAAVEMTSTDPVDVIQGRLDDEPAVVIDTSPSAETLTTAIELVRPAGVIVVSGFKRGDVRLTESIARDLVAKGVTIKGGRSKGLDSLNRAIRLIQTDEASLQRISTNAFPLAEALRAVELFGGLHDGIRRPHVRIEPGLERT